MPSLHTINDFLALCFEDRMSGRLQPMQYYQRVFPGHEEMIAREYVALPDASAGTAPCQVSVKSPAAVARHWARSGATKVTGRDSRNRWPRRRTTPEKGFTGEVLTLGPYQMVKEIGRGGQGVVYLAEDLRLHRRVALKVLTGLGPASEDVIRRFRREAEVTSRLDHPGICAVYDAGVEDGMPFIAMRFVEGETLAHRIATAKKAAPGDGEDSLDLESAAGAGPEPGKPWVMPSGPGTHEALLEVVEVIERSARALHAAHEAGIIHRDVKPGNIILGSGRQPVIVDFGLARDLEGDLSSVTRTGDFVGTPAYVAPEQLAAQRIRIDSRADIYSLGATLFECLTLRRPFEAPTREGLYQAILTKEPRNPRILNPSLPRDLGAILAVALEKDRDRRYQTALDLAEDLRRFRECEPILARPPSFAIRVLRWIQRRPAAAALLLVLAVSGPLIGWFATDRLARERDLDRAHREQEAATLAAEVESGLRRGFLEMHADPTIAAATFRRVIATSSGNPEALAGLAHVLSKENEFQEILDILDRFQDQRELPYLKRIRAYALRDLHRTTEAERLERDLGAAASALDHFVIGLRCMEQATCGNVDRPMSLYEEAFEHYTRAVILAGAARPVFHFERAHAAMHLKDRTRVEDATAIIEQLWPDSPAAWEAIGQGWLDIDDSRSATAYGRAVAAGASDSSTRRRHLGSLIRAGRVDEVLAASECYLTLAPDLGCLVLRARAFRRLSRSGEAAAVLRKAVARPDADVDAFEDLVETLLELGHLPEAVEAARAARHRFPDDERSLRLELLTLSQGQDPEAYLALAREALNRTSVGAELRTRIATGLIDFGSVDEAVTVLQGLVADDPESGTTRILLAAALVRSGRTADALETWELAWPMVKGSEAQAVLGLARELRTRQCDPEADQVITAATARFPEVIGLWDELCTLREESKGPDSAVEISRAFVDRHPESAEAWSTHGRMLRLAERAEESEPALRRALDLDPECLAACHDLAHLLSDIGKHDEAVAAMRKAIGLGSGKVEYQSCLGEILEEAGRVDEAVEAFSEAVKADPKGHESWHRLFHLHYKDRNFEDALGAARHAADLAPDDVHYLSDLAKALIKNRDRAAAATIAADIVRRFGDDAEAIDKAIEVYKDLGDRLEVIRLECLIPVRTPGILPAGLVAEPVQAPELSRVDRSGHLSGG